MRNQKASASNPIVHLSKAAIFARRQRLRRASVTKKQLARQLAAAPLLPSTKEDEHEKENPVPLSTAHASTTDQSRLDRQSTKKERQQVVHRWLDERLSGARDATAAYQRLLVDHGIVTASGSRTAPKPGCTDRHTRSIHRKDDTNSSSHNLYEIFWTVPPLGVGAFGTVRQGRHRLTGIHVAIKILKKSKIKTMTDARRCAREVALLKAAGDHPNVVRLYEVLPLPREIWLVMEYAAGGELFDYIVARGCVDEYNAARIFLGAADAVLFLHARGIVHRDLKPENMLLIFDSDNAAAASGTIDQRRYQHKHRRRKQNTIIAPGHEMREQIVRGAPRVKLIDFGLGAWIDADEDDANDRVSAANSNCRDDRGVIPATMLMTSATGSPCYAAPEVLTNNPLYDGRSSDVWSLGVVLYALLCGHLPFDDLHKPTLFKKIRRGDFSLPKHVSEPAASLIRGMLTVDPKRRLTLQQVVDHHFFFNGPQLLCCGTMILHSLACPLWARVVQSRRDVQPRVLAFLEARGYTRAHVIDSLVNKRCDDAAALYWFVYESCLRRSFRGSGRRRLMFANTIVDVNGSFLGERHRKRSGDGLHHTTAADIGKLLAPIENSAHKTSATQARRYGAQDGDERRGDLFNEQVAQAQRRASRLDRPLRSTNNVQSSRLMMQMRVRAEIEPKLVRGARRRLLAHGKYFAKRHRASKSGATELVRRRHGPAAQTEAAERLPVIDLYEPRVEVAPAFFEVKMGKKKVRKAKAVDETTVSVTGPPWHDSGDSTVVSELHDSDGAAGGLIQGRRITHYNYRKNTGEEPRSLVHSSAPVDIFVSAFLTQLQAIKGVVWVHRHAAPPSQRDSLDNGPADDIDTGSAGSVTHVELLQEQKDKGGMSLHEVFEREREHRRTWLRASDVEGQIGGIFFEFKVVPRQRVAANATAAKLSVRQNGVVAQQWTLCGLCRRGNPLVWQRFRERIITRLLRDEQLR